MKIVDGKKVRDISSRLSAQASLDAAEKVVTEQALEKITKDIKTSAQSMSVQQARFAVDYYYSIQRFRIQNSNRLFAIQSAGDSDEPHSFLEYLFKQGEIYENQIYAGLVSYAKALPEWPWMESVSGIGPIITAGLSAYVDIHKAPTVGHIWVYAGLDPRVRWVSSDEAKKTTKAAIEEADGDLVEATYLLDGKLSRSAGTVQRLALGIIPAGDSEEETNEEDQKVLTPANIAAAVSKRPWNANLKTLCWKIGDAFTKVSGKENAYYGQVYKRRKAYEIERNESGANAEVAARDIVKFGKSTEAYKHYLKGKLPPGRLQLRAQRYAVKLFLSHYHHVRYELTFKQPPPKPYAIAYLEHAHYLAPPNLEAVGLETPNY